MIAHGRLRVEELSARNREAATAYLSRSPFENVFLTHAVRDGGPLLRDVRIAFDGNAVAGIALLGSQVVLAADEAALPLLARAATHRESAIVGPRKTVRAYWALVSGSHAPARLVRDRQPVMAVDRSSLRTRSGVVRVRQAREDEWEIVARNSAAMIAAETETTVRAESPEFGSGIRRMIAMGLWWVGQSDDELCFFCNVGAWSDETALLQGIWTPPALRGRGLAAGALGAICDRLLRIAPSLSLYVNEGNAPAIALYRALGFRAVAEFQTLFF